MLGASCQLPANRCAAFLPRPDGENELRREADHQDQGQEEQIEMQAGDGQRGGRRAVKAAD